MDAKGQRRKSDPVTRQFVHFASSLTAYFPELDLRFNLRGDSKTLRYRVPELTADVFELDLDPSLSIEELIHEAAFTIKELAQRFDA